MKCFNCQQEGHVAAECRWYTELTPALPRRPDAVPPRRDPEPPSASYLQARAELGTPANPAIAEILGVRCPWCEAGPWQHCVNRALGTPKQRPHEARYQAAKVPVPAAPDLADVARRQVDEYRAARAASPLENPAPISRTP